MNRPCDKYCFLADYYSVTNLKMLRTFGEVCREELRNNPDGIQFPVGHLRIIRRKTDSSNHTLKEKYGKDYKIPNDHTEGQVITTKFFASTDSYNNTGYSFRFGNIFKFHSSKALKRVQKEIAESNEYLKFDLVNKTRLREYGLKYKK